ncbi:hypothetical protein [Sorangium sp. So ce204]|uniref:hypothetical protein n=1 Tax=Sorangium sp. So ce204 TaxID=3133288 RepID=UPI003F5D9260
MTARSFADLRATSPDGGLCLEALSADNGNELVRDGALVKGSSYRIFQKNFRYRLMDARNQAPLWQHWQDRSEGSPVAAWVSNDGYVVVHAHPLSVTDQLLFFTRAGEKALVVVIAPEGADPGIVPERAPKRRRDRRHGPRPRVVLWADRHVCVSTAGPIWSQGSLMTFVRDGDATYFSLRAGWGRRLIVDLGAMAPLDEGAAKGVEAAIEAVETERALGVLSEFVAQAEPEASDWRRWRDVEGALAVVIARRPPDAVPLLRRVEARRGRSSSSASAVLGKGSHCTHRSSTRSLARLALRALGQEPAAGGNYAFVRSDASFPREGDAEVPTAAPAAAWRVARATPSGASALDVLATAGPPDFIHKVSRQVDRYYASSELWDYDGPESTTRIVWSIPETSKRSVTEQPRQVVRVVDGPPVWQGDERLLVILGFQT